MATDVQPASPTRPAPRASVPPSTVVRSASADTRRVGAWWKRGIFAVAAVALVGTAASFMLGAVSQEETRPKLTHTIMRRDLDVTVTEDGSLESSSNTEVRCKVKGASSTIVWIIENGTEVKPGDVLVRIDTSTIEDNINTQKIAYQNALATYAQSESDVAVAEINVTEYEEGTYPSELKTKEKDLAIAKANLTTAQNILQYTRKTFQKGYISQLEVESSEFTLQQAQLELEVFETELDVLKRYTRAKQLQDLGGILKAKRAKLASDKAALDLEKDKLEREEQQLENCVIRAEVEGMAIYGGSEKWEDRPDIREGATVREDQVLLLIPDLNQMQVKVAVHEAKIDRVKLGLRAQVELQDRTYDGEVLSVASMARPAGWWNGNMVKYETVIKLDTQSNVKPGMSAAAVIFLAQHTDVLTIPVGAVVEQEGRFYCWVTTDAGIQRRELVLGDSDDQFIVVSGGVKEGDDVVLNPLAYIEQAQSEALKPFSGIKPEENEGDESTSKNPDRMAFEQAKPESAEAGAATKSSQPQITGAQLLKMADKNGDGVLTEDEFAEKDRGKFGGADLNNDGKVDEAELDTAVKKMTEAAAGKP